MEELLSEYLFRYRSCPLPGIGELHYKSTKASYSQADQMMLPPVPYIALSQNHVDEQPLVRYIATNGNISEENAQSTLNEWCKRLLKSEGGEKELPGAGMFTVNESGNLVFNSYETSLELFPAVSATRVVRRQASHSILVGDKESTSAIMTEYYSANEVKKSSGWWIAALVIALIASSVIVFYMNDGRNSQVFGNAAPIEPRQESKTYTVLP